MRVVVAGASGLIGTALCRALSDVGHEVVALLRRPEPAVRQSARFRPVIWDPRELGPWQDEVSRADAVVNLAGASIAGKRWNDDYRRILRRSRLDPTRAIVKVLADNPREHRVLVNASASGFYGDRGDEVLHEDAPPGDDFLAKLCRDWEVAASGAHRAGVRVVLLRLAPVLSREGGMIEKLLPTYRLGLGGPLGSGRQWMPWIHIDDVVGIAVLALDRVDIAGALNVCAPRAVRNREFVRALGRIMGRPAILPVPAPVLRLAVGEFAWALLASQRIGPAALEALGYQWRYAALEAALRATAEPRSGRMP